MVIVPVLFRRTKQICKSLPWTLRSILFCVNTAVPDHMPQSTCESYYEECSDTVLQDSLGPVPEHREARDGFLINNDNLISTTKVDFMGNSVLIIFVSCCPLIGNAQIINQELQRYDLPSPVRFPPSSTQDTLTLANALFLLLQVLDRIANANIFPNLKRTVFRNIS